MIPDPVVGFLITVCRLSFPVGGKRKTLILAATGISFVDQDASNNGGISAA